MTARDVSSYDVVVIGAGLVGVAIARELAGTDLSVAILEARNDVGDGTSKANTAILHTGFDAKPGTLESTLVRRGYDLLSDYAAQTGIPIERTGAILVAWNDEEREALPGLQSKAVANGYVACELVDAEAVYAALPALAAGALGGLTVPDESITCTWTANLALAADAVLRGCAVRLNHRVESMDVQADHTTMHTSSGDVRARWVVNAAGLAADTVDSMLGYDRFTVTPRRGELLVFDKLARPMVPMIVLPVPSSLGKGVLVSPTIYGNVMLGPTAEDLDDRSQTRTSESGFDFLAHKGELLMPQLLSEEVTASYAGLRAAIDRDDYLIEADADRRYCLVGGIRSTGLTACMAIAEYVVDLMSQSGLRGEPRTDLPSPPLMPNLGEAGIRPYVNDELIKRDPAYGDIVCFCERVTLGEIRDAFAGVVPPNDLNGLRRRTRIMNGRCQGFYCGARAQALTEEHLLASGVVS